MTPFTRSAMIGIGLVVTISAPASCLAQCSGDFIFGQPFTAPSTNYSQGGAVGDFNSDGAEDVILLRHSTTAASVYMGLLGSSPGSQILTGPMTVAAGTSAIVAVPADFNRDGVIDVAVCSPDLMFLAGRSGPITNPPFASPMSGTIGNGSTYAGISSDLNGDELPDLALAGSWIGGYSLAVKLGNGNGTFSATTFYTGPTITPSSLCAADFNGDGTVDLAVVYPSDPVGTVCVFANDGLGGFGGVRTDFTVGPIAASIAATDLNADGYNDLIVANAGYSGSITVLLGTGNLGPIFGPSISFPAGAQPYRLAVQDFNGDGKPDVATATQKGIAVLTGNGQIEPSTQMLAPPALYSSDGRYETIWVGDYNGDGRKDFFSTGTATFSDGGYYYITTSLGNDCLPEAEARPQALSVQDVALDQGGKVKVNWKPSGYDRPIDRRTSEYQVWRSVNAQQHVRRPMRIAASIDSFWEHIATIPAVGLKGYSVLAGTPFDSTAAANPRTYFFVQAKSTDGRRWFSSEVDSGYSVDNLAPVPVLFLAAHFTPAQGIRIHWGPGPDPDVGFYVVYRVPTNETPLTPNNEIAVVPDNVVFDMSINGPAWYKVIAVDVHGNRSEPASIAPDQISGIELMGVPSVSYLDQNRPNPFNPLTTMEYGIARPGLVRLRIYDVSGRLVATLIDRNLPAGKYTAYWDGLDGERRRVGSGVYLARLEGPDVSKSVRLVLTR